MTRGRVRTYVAFHDILTCSNFRLASSQWHARNRVNLLTRVAQATRVAVKYLLKTVDNFTVKWYPAAIAGLKTGFYIQGCKVRAKPSL